MSQVIFSLSSVINLLMCESNVNVCVCICVSVNIEEFRTKFNVAIHILNACLLLSL